MSYTIAVAGLGKIATDQHLPCIARNPAFTLVAGVSRNATIPSVPCFKSIAALAESGLKVDAVSLCTPPSVRLAMAQEALAAGYHLLIEKPPTPTMGEAYAIIEAAQKAGRVAYFTWHSRYNRAVEEARARLAGKRVAKLKVIWREDVRHWHPGQQWIWEAGGFGVFDPGINAFSIVTRIMPEPIFVASGTIEVPANSATAIAADIRFKHADARPSDMSANLDWRQTGEQTWDIEIVTDDGLELNLRRGGSVLEVNGAVILKAPLEEYELIYDRFANLLRTNTSATDLSPLQLVNDCLMLAKPVVTDAFEW
jgi:D-galactose 1-dehydrogenase